MVKTVLGVNHQGLRDWFWQRITGVMMVIYVLALTGFILGHPHTQYYEWHGLFGFFWVKIATALTMLALLYHAWIGMWTVYTDYIKIVWLNVTLQVITVLALIYLFLETLQVLWGV